MFEFSFNWRDEFNTNIEIIDFQHKELFRICRGMEQLIQKQCIGVEDRQLLEIVCELRDFAGYHFYEEEELMNEYHYPFTNEHEKIHAQFVVKISEINMLDLKKHPVTELIKIKDEVQEKLFSHILTEDKKMADYILKQREKEVSNSILTSEEPEDVYEDLYGMKICDLDVTKLYLFREQSHKGRVVLVYKYAIQNMEKLSVLERNIFYGEVVKVAKVLKKIYNPDSFNYASYDDMQDRLHVHIVPKYKEQFEWKEVFQLDPSQIILSDEASKEMVEEIRQGLLM